MSNAVKNDRPAVLLPAPVYMGLCLLAGELLEWWQPVFNGPSTVVFIAGWCVQILAFGLLLWCFAVFMRKRTTIMPANPVSTLVNTGPYRLSRNPMYLALAMIQLGIALSTANAWDFLTLAVYVLLTRLLVINPEERYLRQRFGDAYVRYCAQVPRWIGLPGRG